jgi:hypothetical protein
MCAVHERTNGNEGRGFKQTSHTCAEMMALPRISYMLRSSCVPVASTQLCVCVCLVDGRMRDPQLCLPSLAVRLGSRVVQVSDCTILVFYVS